MRQLWERMGIGPVINLEEHPGPGAAPLLASHEEKNKIITEREIERASKDSDKQGMMTRAEAVRVALGQVEKVEQSVGIQESIVSHTGPYGYTEPS